MVQVDHKFTLPIFTLSVTQLFAYTYATLVNLTIDDAGADPFTGTPVAYTKPGWHSSSDVCSNCWAHPDSNRVYSKTWHDATYDVQVQSISTPQNATFEFIGSALYAYGVTTEILNSTSAPSSSDIYFYIDNEAVGNYTHTPNGSNGYNYDVLLYANISMTHAEHIFTLQNGREGGQTSFILFDYLIYSRNVTAAEPSTIFATITSTTTVVSGASENPYHKGGTPPAGVEPSRPDSNLSGRQLLIICLSILLPSAAVLVAAITICWRLKHHRRPPKTIFIDVTRTRTTSPSLVIKDGQSRPSSTTASSAYGGTASSAIVTSRSFSVDASSQAPASDLVPIIPHRRSPPSIASSVLSYWEPGQIVQPAPSIDGYIPYIHDSSHRKRASIARGTNHHLA